MTNPGSLHRRGFIAAQAAAAAVLTTSPATLALASPTAAGDATLARRSLDWSTVGADDLAARIGRRFRFTDAEGGTVPMRLVAVEPVSSGPARPADLPRAEGVIAVFDGPDKAALVAAGHRSYRVSHAGIGSAPLYAGPSPNRDGSHRIEIVLN